MNSIVSINAENIKKMIGYINKKIYDSFTVLRNGSITFDKEKFIKTTNEIIIFLIMVIGVEKTVKLFWCFLKIIIGCGYTIRYLVTKKNIKNIENIENIENKVIVNEMDIGSILIRLDKINVEMGNINVAVQHISKNMDINATGIDMLKKNVNFGVMGTDYYAPF